MVRRSVEYYIANPTNLVSAEEVESLADKEERPLAAKECLSGSRDVLIRRVSNYDKKQLAVRRCTWRDIADGHSLR